VGRQPLDTAVLLRVEHAVVRVLASARTEDAVWPELLAAIGGELGWDGAALWLTGEPPVRAATWQAPPPESELAARVLADGRPAWTDGALAVPVPDVGVLELWTASGHGADPELLATVSDLGLQIAQFAERCRADAAVRAADARKSAILNAAFDCIITMDHEGRVVEANAAAERTFGYSSAELVGHELAALIIPPSLRELHRNGLERFVESGRSKVTGHRLEALGMRADGSEFPIELIVTRPELPGPPVFCGYLRDVTEQRERERALRKLADEQAALRRVATAVAAETDPASVFGLVTEEVGRMLGAETANMLRYDGDRFATVVGEWSRADVPAVPVGETVEMDGNTAAARVWQSRAPSRVDDYGEVEGELAAKLRGLGFKSAVAAPIVLGGLWGAVVVSSVGEAFPPGAEQRIADFAELAAQALANAQSRQDLAASRARIVQAGDAERRRLERNLHDGAQQRLVSLALMLRMASRRHAQDPELEQAAEELSRALEELRELARGIHPAVLTERGLEPALVALAARAPLPVELEVAAERLPEPVEAAAYYLVAEALTNVAKYAHANEVRVHVARENGQASIEVADDGVGGAHASGGSGLRGLSDRVEALGGRLELDSPTGAGTRLRAEIPCR
jgi:PAS domain S-box-containing protein